MIVWYIKAFDSKLYLSSEDELRNELEMLFDNEYFNGIQEEMNEEPFALMWNAFVGWIRSKDFEEWFGIDNEFQDFLTLTVFEKQVYSDCSIGYCYMTQEDFEAIPEHEGW